MRWKGSALYAGALYAVRQEDQTYKVLEVNNSYEVGRRPLVAPRAFCVSPFNDDSIYIGGHDSSRKVSDNMAWIFNAPTDVVLGKTKGESFKSLGARVKPDKRLLSGPVYELRIYSANELRFGNLIERFREHTDRLFKKHGLQVVGYWTPTEGPSKKRRRFIYILKHNSRYDAYLNWVSFSNDKEWERVLDQPKFQGLLALKPESLFMQASEFSGMIDGDKITPGGIYELRTYVANPGKLKSAEEKYTKNIVKLLQMRGIKDLFGWRAFDPPESKNTFIRLLHHPSEKEAVLNWKSFINDNEHANVQAMCNAWDSSTKKGDDRISEALDAYKNRDQFTKTFVAKYYRLVLFDIESLLPISAKVKFGVYMDDRRRRMATSGTRSWGSVVENVKSGREVVNFHCRRN